MGIDKEYTPTFGFDAYFKNIHVGFEGGKAHFTENIVIPAGGFNVGTINFAAGNTLETDIYYTWYRGTIGYTSYLSKKVGIGFDAHVEYFRFKHTLTDNVNSERLKIESFVPSFGMHVDFAPNDRFLITVGSHAGYLDMKHHVMWKVHVNGHINFFTC